MSTERMFPVMAGPWVSVEGYPAIARGLPWDMVAPHEPRAQSNHAQSLEQLAQRGGLSPREMMALLGDVPLREMFRRQGAPSEADCVVGLVRRLEQYRRVVRAP